MRHIQGIMSLWVGLLLFFTLIAWMIDPELSSRALVADIGTIGTSAAVEANPLNTLAAELAARSEDLDERERYISEEEARAGAADNFFTYGLWGAAAILFFLLIVNLYLDYEVHDIRRRMLNPVPKP